MLVALVLSCVPLAVHSSAGASGAPEVSRDQSHAEAAMLLQKKHSTNHSKQSVFSTEILQGHSTSRKQPVALVFTLDTETIHLSTPDTATLLNSYI